MELLVKRPDALEEPVLETEIIDDALGSTLGVPVEGDETLPGAQERTGGSSAAASQTPQFTLGDRFLPIRPHARGGIGLVWVARDCELQRDVALKVIQPRYAERADQRTRFVLEAEITGKLEHPGIVPVYSLGQNAEGRPYYAMRFIRGESLSAAIKQFHQARRQEAESAGKRAPSMWGIEFRQLLRSFLDVCDTIDYAHSRGVLHRDIKPANIMLGRYGETLVVDWGLAKVIGKTDVATAQGGSDLEPSLQQETSATSGETQQGMAIGTPSYMSPEQASGLIDELGPASDVYSLGATLYELLTGQLAFPGEKVLEILEKVRKGDFPPPRSICRSLPAPLEAICCKAMALKPDDRFASVRALAQDIEHWLADEPVMAYPEGRLERLGRWFRQHRTWTYAAVATLVGGCLVATIAAVVIEGSRQSEAAARREAEVNFRMAQEAVDNYLTNVSESTLLKEQDSVDLRNLRQELLQSALKYYEQFVQQRGADPRLRHELANAYFRVAEITQEIASPHEAIGSFGSARTIWEQLAAAEPKNDEIQGQLAACLLAIGKAQDRTGNLPGALNSLSQALAILEALAARRPEAALYQANLADCLANIGVIRAKLESPDQALDMLQKAKAIRQQLIERSPQDFAYQRSLAEVINEQGYVFYKRHDYPAALQAFQEMQEICQSLLKQIQIGPKPVKILEWLARSYYNMATIQLNQNQKEQALRSLEQSVYYQSALAETHSSVTTFRADLGTSYRALAGLQHDVGQDDKARASVQRALAIFEPLVHTHPDHAGYRAALARSWNTSGYLYDEAHDNPKAIPEFKRAVVEQERAIAASKDVNEYKASLSTYLENLGEQYIDQGQVDEGLEHYQKALELREKLHLVHPGTPEYTVNLAQARSTIGEIQRQAGLGSAARMSFTRARELLQHVPAAQAGTASISTQLGMVLTREAVALAEEQKPEDALPLLAQALQVLRPLGSGPGSSLQERERLSEALWQLARIERIVGKSADVPRIEAQRLALWKGRPAEELADLALKEAGRAALIGYGRAPIPPPAKPAREHDLDLAAADLRLAISQGFTNFAKFRSKADAAILLEREDLKALLKSLGATGHQAERQPQK
jgi:serine/threonine-protein kinase